MYLFERFSSSNNHWTTFFNEIFITHQPLNGQVHALYKLKNDNFYFSVENQSRGNTPPPPRPPSPPEPKPRPGVN